MFPYLPSSLDRLASEGIVDFDSESYIKGTPARYVGGPSHYLPFEQPLNTYENCVPVGPSGPQIKQQPANDQFVNNNSNNKNWKKILLAGIGATLLAVVGIKYGGKIASLFKKAPPPPPPPPAPAKTSFWKKIPKWVKITAGGLTGALALFGIQRVVKNKKSNNAK